MHFPLLTFRKYEGGDNMKRKSKEIKLDCGRYCRSVIQQCLDNGEDLSVCEIKGARCYSDCPNK